MLTLAQQAKARFKALPMSERIIAAHREGKNAPIANYERVNWNPGNNYHQFHFGYPDFSFLNLNLEAAVNRGWIRSDHTWVDDPKDRPQPANMAEAAKLRFNKMPAEQRIAAANQECAAVADHHYKLVNYHPGDSCHEYTFRYPDHTRLHLSLAARCMPGWINHALVRVDAASP